MAVARQLFAHHGRVGVAVASHHIGQDALERVFFLHTLACRSAAAKGVGKGNLLIARAVQNDVAHLLRQLLERLIHAEAVVLGQTFDQGKVILVAFVPALDGTACQAQRGGGHHPLGVEGIDRAQAIAFGAGTLRRVERKHARLQRRNAVMALGAGVTGVEQVLGRAIHLHYEGAPIGQPQGRLETFCQPLAGVGPYFQAVDHHVDVVPVVFF